MASSSFAFSDFSRESASLRRLQEEGEGGERRRRVRGASAGGG
jgi:hypothetical protein